MATIEIYATRFCPFSVWARRLLNEKGVRYQVYDLDEEPERRAEMQARGGRHTVPQIFVDDQAIGGFDGLSELQQSGELDAMLGLPVHQPEME